MAGRRTVLIDTNLLTLWIVGNISEAAVTRCKRTKRYSVEDYQKLSAYVSKFANVAITPNVAAETSNLIGVLAGEHLRRGRLILAAGLAVWEERYVQGSQAAREPDYLRLGLTDAALILATTEDSEVVTDDFDLYQALMRRRIPVKNFTHWRAAGWFED